MSDLEKAERSHCWRLSTVLPLTVALPNMRICYLAYSLIAFAVLGNVQANQPSLDNAPIARTMNGSYKGIYLAQYNQDLFLGLPYAHPPIETRRFRHPAHLTTNWTGERPATKYAFVRTCSGLNLTSQSQFSTRLTAAGMHRLRGRPERLPPERGLSLLGRDSAS